MTPETQKLFNILHDNINDDLLVDVIENSDCSIGELENSPLDVVEKNPGYDSDETFYENSDDSVKDPDYNVIIDESSSEDEGPVITVTNVSVHRMDEDSRSIIRQNEWLVQPEKDLNENNTTPGSGSFAEITTRKRTLNKHAQSEIDNEIIIENTDFENENLNQATSLSLIERSNQHLDDTTRHDTDTSFESVPPIKGRPKRGRKPKMNTNREVNKTMRYQNLPYATYKNEVVPAKKFKDYTCSCLKRCARVISKQRREIEFKTYNTLGSYIAQTFYLISNVKEIPKKRSYTTSSIKKTNRQFSRVYMLDGVVVCKDMFLNTLQVSPQKITGGLKKQRDGGVANDKRGKAQGGWNKLPEESVKFITDIIERLPKYISHYTREKNNDALYLELGMTISKIYNLYMEEFEKKYGKTKKCVSLSKVRNIFITKFNLRCKPAKHDTCNKCDMFNIQLSNRLNPQYEQIDLQHKTHVNLAEGLRQQMEKDFATAKNNPKRECLTFDLEKTLPLPRIPTNVVFYKRQLWVYNSGIHVASTDTGYCNVWVEGEAGRGAQEVGSCLIHHIDNFLDPTVEDLILWSDSCGGQNRNIKLTLILKVTLDAHPRLQTISLRYLEPGHTFLPNDTDFSNIESRLRRHQRIYTLQEYMDVMKHCKKKNPLKVIRMENFVSSKILEKNIVNRKIFKNNEKVNWLKTKEILLKKDDTTIYMRTSFEKDFNELDINKKVKKEVVLINKSQLQPLWPKGKAIAQAKLDDIKSLLVYIPLDCQEFYKSLRGDKNIQDDVDGFGDRLDFDLENAEDEEE